MSVRCKEFTIIGKRPYEFKPEGQNETISGYTLFVSRPFDEGEGLGEMCGQVSVGLRAAAMYKCDIGDTISCARVSGKLQMLT